MDNPLKLILDVSVQLQDALKSPYNLLLVDGITGKAIIQHPLLLYSLLILLHTQLAVLLN